jgi:hypothetical protein
VPPGLQTPGQRVAPRNSTHFSALDNSFRFIDGMTKGGGRRFTPEWVVADGQSSAQSSNLILFERVLLNAFSKLRRLDD